MRSTSRIGGIGALIVLALCSVGRGEPRLLLPRDERAAPIIAAGRELLIAIQEDDEQRIAQLFIGDAQRDRPLLDARLRFVRAGKALAAELKSHPNQPRLEQLAQFGSRPRSDADGLAKLLVMQNGDDALIASNGLLQPGMTLHKQGDAWKVVNLCSDDRYRAAELDLMNVMVTGIEKIVADVRAGVTEDAIVKQSDAPFREATDKYFMAVMNLTGERPTAAPDGATISLSDVQQTIGALANDPKVGDLIAKFPGLPTVAESSASIFISSRGAGVEIRIDGTTARVHTVTLHPDDQAGFRAFAGPLPFGLAFGARRADVQRKLGLPDMSSGGGKPSVAMNYTATYAKLGLTVAYASPALRDPDNAVALVSLSAPLPIADRAEAPRDGKASTLSFRLVATDDEAKTVACDERTDPDRPGVTLHVRRDAILDDSSVQYVMPGMPSDDKGMTLYIELTDDGATKLERATSANIGKPLAIVLDDEVLMAPTIRTAVKNSIVIELGRGSTRDRVGPLLARIHAAISRLPDAATTQPAGAK